MEQLGRGRKDSHRRSAFVCISYHGFNFWGMGTGMVQDSPSAGTSNEGRAFEAPLTLLRWGASNAASALKTRSARQQKECVLDTLVLRVDEDAHMRLEGRRDGLPWTNSLRGSVRCVKDLLELVAKGVSLSAAHEGSI